MRQRGLAGWVAVGAVLMLMPLTAAAANRIVISGSGYKPARFHPDNRTLATGFKWSSWNAGRAIGSGTTKTCAPGGVNCTTTRQTMIYSRVRRMCGQMSYTRFRFSKWPARGQLLDDGGVCHWIT